MKRQAYTIAAIVLMAGLFAVSSAKAQASGPARLTANIPFEFSAGNETLPAGEYVVSCTNPTSRGKVLHFRNKDGRHSVMIQTSDVIGPVRDYARLIFRRYGNRYFLAQAWMPADNNGLEARKSRTERTVEHEFALTKAKTETVALKVKQW
jgi:hypothetical protein